MKEKQNRKNGRQLLEERAEAIAAPIAEQFGIYIYDVEYVKEGQEYFLNVYIDKEGGVTINDCENVSRILSDDLDEADLIRDPYTLIVSSPGLGRALTKDRHLRQSIGQDVEIHLYRQHTGFGVKDLCGELVEFDGETISILTEPPAPEKGKGGDKGKKKSKSRGKKSAAVQTEDETLVMEKSICAKQGESFVPAGPVPSCQEQDETAAQNIQSEQDEQIMRDGRIRLCIERKNIASVRLAFDF